MSIRQLYSSLNVLYLKLFQYEKYVDEDIADTLFDCINRWLFDLKDNYNAIYRLNQMSLDELFAESQIDIYFEHNVDREVIQYRLIHDLDVFRNQNVLMG
jgi:hypothetical protein